MIDRSQRLRTLSNKPCRGSRRLYSKHLNSPETMAETRLRRKCIILGVLTLKYWQLVEDAETRLFTRPR